jgi:hypothetical protein
VSADIPLFGLSDDWSDEEEIAAVALREAFRRFPLPWWRVEGARIVGRISADVVETRALGGSKAIQRPPDVAQVRGVLAEPVVTSAPPIAETREQYLSVKELATRIPYAEQTIRNFICRGVFRLDVHYVKPNGRGRPIFKWTAIQKWLETQ